MKRDIPEVLQTSAMDCGPAALAALLQGCDIPASYGRLREICQTSVDGTSLDTLEQVAQKLGLDARQILLPREVALEPQNLPALLVVQREDQGLHFVVAWRRSGHQVQVMDPSRGRIWLSVSSVLRRMYVHVQPMPGVAWRRWAAGPTGLELLCGWMDGLGLSQKQQEEQLEAALADPGWEGFAALFACLRLLRLLKEEGELKEATTLLARLLPLARAEAHDPRSVPYDFWPVHPADEGVAVVGVVGLVVRGRHPTEALGELGGELAAVLQHREPSPWPLVAQTLRASEPRLGLRLGVLVAGLAGGALLELLFWRLLVELGTVLGSPPGRVLALGAGALLAAALLCLRWAGDSEMLRLGRHVELRLRVALLSHLPRLGDRYFHSRPVSDLAERAHALHLLRNLPAGLFQALRALVDLVVTITILGLLLPASLPLTIAISLISLGIPWVLQRGMQEAAQRQGGLAGAVARVGLDALAGGVALRTHGAGSALAVEYEGLLVELVRAGRALQRVAVGSAVLGSVVGSLGIAALLSLGAYQESLSLLYLLFAMRLPMIGQGLGTVFLQLPATRAHLLRLLEPLSTPVEPVPEGTAPPLPNGALNLELVGVQVEAAGHPLLNGVDLRVAPGEHVAIVGRSGAGKSTLLSLFLGWNRACAGELRVGGRPLDGALLEQLRSRVAWVDPAIQLWNRSLLDNLRYGSEGISGDDAALLERAELRGLLGRLPEGLQTPLGEGGTRLSGGEGQRVRLARAMRRPQPGLVLLDEPFRGLDRGARHRLLAESRRTWVDSTLLCITHDMSETLDFPRVLVVEEGRIVEDGAPSDLMKKQGRYATLLRAEEQLRAELWEGATWRRLRVEAGHVHEERP